MPVAPEPIDHSQTHPLHCLHKDSVSEEQMRQDRSFAEVTRSLGGETAELLTRLMKEVPVVLLQGRGRLNEWGGIYTTAAPVRFTGTFLHLQQCIHLSRFISPSCSFEVQYNFPVLTHAMIVRGVTKHCWSVNWSWQLDCDSIADVERFLCYHLLYCTFVWSLHTECCWVSCMSRCPPVHHYSTAGTRPDGTYKVAVGWVGAHQFDQNLKLIHLVQRRHSMEGRTFPPPALASCILCCRNCSECAKRV